MTTLVDIHAEIAKYVRVVPGITDCYYPAPNSLSGSMNAVVYAMDFDNTESQETYHIGTSRVVLYAAPTDTASAISKTDTLAFMIQDQFSAKNTQGYHLTGLVDRCFCRRFELSRVLEYGDHTYFGGTFYLDLKIRRFAGAGYPI